MGYINMYSMGAGLVAILAVSYQFGLVHLTNMTSVLVYLGVTMVGFILGFVMVMFSGKKRKQSMIANPSPAANVLVMKVMEVLSRKHRRPRGLVVSRNMDKAIKEVFDLIMKDFVMSWYTQLGQDTDVFTSALEEDMWEFLENLLKRLKNIDKVRFFTSDIVYKLCDHFAELRDTTVKDAPNPKPFLLHPCLISEEAEREFLRETTEVMLVLMLPAGIANSDTARHLLREIITCGVLKPAVDMICDPYFINSMLVSFLEHREILAENHKRKYAYAASYEEFIKLINLCNEIQELQQIRYHIITEIMHATMIQDLKKSRGPEADKSAKSRGKANLLRVRNLKRYINQCKVAKVQCERRLALLGGPEYQVYNRSAHSKPLDDLRPQRVLTLDEILSNKVARAYLTNFLKKDGKDDLLNFWVAVDRLRASKKAKDQHMYANEIYQTYIATTSAVKVDKGHVKGMADFLAADKGPESFYSAQHQVYQELDETYYPSFLVSDTYTKLMSSLGEQRDKGAREDLSPEVLEKKGFNTKVKPEVLPTDETSFEEQTVSVMSKLQFVDERLSSKQQALSNLKSAHSSDSKMQQMLEKEIEQLRLEKLSLEVYIERTDLWCDYIGKWRTDICSAQILDEGDKVVPYYVIVVHPIDPSISIPGWVVSRRLGDFHALQQRLKECSKWVGKMELPQVSRKPFKKLDQDFLTNSQVTLQKYLTSVVQDETLRHSEVLYTFLVPTPECLRTASKEEKKEKKGVFSFAGIFKSAIGDQEDDQGAEDTDADEESVQDRWDSTAEPLYTLISEVFELHGMFKWLRRKLIFFVQSTFGGTINKQLRETVEWFVSEPMIIYYIRMLQDSIWPKGKLAPAQPVPSPEQRDKTKKKAKEKFLQYLPDFLQSVLGKTNSRFGAIKVFDAFQDIRTNKHLVYTIIEQALLEVCPELKDPRLLEHLEEEERKLQEQRKKAAEEAAAKKKEEDKEEMVTKTDEEVGEEVDENNTKEDSGASETREGFDDEDNQDASDEDEDDDDDAPKGLEENGLDTEDGELSNKENTSIEDLGPREDGVGGPD
ncbi:sorting nexin-25-like isoform X1 [Asterias rubens]|uniref:sorting nexin-25-like isoform X1 n=1 Tax=Asterias rubens TaxID=7604 RepID=UPI00145548CE|nr:sorting nexin-25-like isoform X1 [Asterias rubens]XP_033631881.1 sorting nexin-25-like isoform X1 [Asterias rubens]